MKEKVLYLLPFILISFFISFLVYQVFTERIGLAQTSDFNSVQSGNPLDSYGSFGGYGSSSCCSPFSTSSGSGSFSGSSCCGGGLSSSGGKIDLKSLEKEAISFYRQKRNSKSTNLKAQVNDYGCHVEIVILEGGKKVASLAYRNGQFFELSY